MSLRLNAFVHLEVRLSRGAACTAPSCMMGSLGTTIKKSSVPVFRLHARDLAKLANAEPQVTRSYQKDRLRLHCFECDPTPALSPNPTNRL